MKQLLHLIFATAMITLALPALSNDFQVLQNDPTEPPAQPDNDELPAQPDNDKRPALGKCSKGTDFEEAHQPITPKLCTRSLDFGYCYCTEKLKLSLHKCQHHHKSSAALESELSQKSGFQTCPIQPGASIYASKNVYINEETTNVTIIRSDLGLQTFAFDLIEALPSYRTGEHLTVDQYGKPQLETTQRKWGEPFVVPMDTPITNESAVIKLPTKE